MSDLVKDKTIKLIDIKTNNISPYYLLKIKMMISFCCMSALVLPYYYRKFVIWV